MCERELARGEGRTRINLLAQRFGGDLVVYICNKNAHIGAVAVGEYDHEKNRSSVSVLTRAGHKDDAIAQKAAYLISKHTKRPSCVIAGVHLDHITKAEIQAFLRNANSLVKDFLKCWEEAGSKQ